MNVKESLFGAWQGPLDHRWLVRTHVADPSEQLGHAIAILLVQDSSAVEFWQGLALHRACDRASARGIDLPLSISDLHDCIKAESRYSDKLIPQLTAGSYEQHAGNVTQVAGSLRTACSYCSVTKKVDCACTVGSLDHG